MQNLLYLTSGGGIWTRSERRVSITENCTSAKAGSPALEGLPLLRTSNGINSQGVLPQLYMQPGRRNDIYKQQVEDGIKPEVLVLWQTPFLFPVPMEKFGVQAASIARYGQDSSWVQNSLKPPAWNSAQGTACSLLAPVLSAKSHKSFFQDVRETSDSITKHYIASESHNLALLTLLAKLLSNLSLLMRSFTGLLGRESCQKAFELTVGCSTVLARYHSELPPAQARADCPNGTSIPRRTGGCIFLHLWETRTLCEERIKHLQDQLFVPGMFYLLFNRRKFGTSRHAPRGWTASQRGHHQRPRSSPWPWIHGTDEALMAGEGGSVNGFWPWFGRTCPSTAFNCH